MPDRTWYWTPETLRLSLRYTFPPKHPTLPDLARALAVAESEVAELEAFRKAHPPRRTRHRGTTWTYILTGNGPQTLVLLHGMAGAYDVWWRILPRLARRARVLSVTYPPLTTAEALAQGLLDLMDALGLERAVFVGSSLGGYIVQTLMAHAKARVEKAVLGNTFPPTDLYRKQYGLLVRLGPWLPEELVRAVFRQGFFFKVHPTSRSPILLAYLLEQSYGPMTKADILGRARAVMQARHLPAPPRDVPVLIIEAENDPLIPPVLRKDLKERFPWAAVHTFPDAGHFPYVNQAETYARLLEDFLT